MRKKIAFLLAVAMIVTLLPVTASAATNNVSVKSISNIAKGTLLFEQDMYSKAGKVDRYVENVNAALGGGTGVKFFADGTDFVIRINDVAGVGARIPLILENASWFFRYNAEDFFAAGGSFASFMAQPLASLQALSLGLTYSQALDTVENMINVDFNYADSDFYVGPTGYQGGMTVSSTYDYTKGIYADGNPIKTAGGDDPRVITGTYYRFAQLSSRADASGTSTIIEIPYRIDFIDGGTPILTILPTDHTISGNGRTATAVLAGENYQSKDGIIYEIRVPIVSITKDGNAWISLGGNTVALSSTKHSVTTFNSASTKTTVSDPDTFRTDYTIGSVKISEQTLGTIHTTDKLEGYDIVGGRLVERAGYDVYGIGGVRLTLPRGYHWYDLNKYYSDVSVVLYPTLSWDGGSYSKSVNGPFFAYGLTGRTYNPSIDDSQLIVYFRGINPSSQITGALEVKGLSFYADETVLDPYFKSEDISLYVNKDASGNNNVPGADLGVTPETVAVAKHRDWNCDLSVDARIIVDGRYVDNGYPQFPTAVGLDASDDYQEVGADRTKYYFHQTGDVTFAEVTPNAWWGARQTVFELVPKIDREGAVYDAADPDVKIRKLKFDGDNVKNITNRSDLLSTSYVSKLYNVTLPAGTYVNDGENHGLVKIDNNKIIINSVKIDQNAKGKINFTLWLSIRYGFGQKYGNLQDDGRADLLITVPSMLTSYRDAVNSGIPAQSTYDADNSGLIPHKVIAHVQDPVHVEIDKLTDVMIGYQYQPTSNFHIIEYFPGALMQDKQLRFSVTDQISSDMVFTNNPTVAVKDPKTFLTLKNFNNVGYSGGASWTGGTLSNSNNGTFTGFSFDIGRESELTAGTIDISNIGVKLDRSVPVTNLQYYKLIVWGSAIAENFGYSGDAAANRAANGYLHRNKFATPGEVLNYLKVVNAADDESLLKRKVTVSIDEKFFTVNGNSYPMPDGVTAKNVDGSTLVPIRFIALALFADEETLKGQNDDATIFDKAEAIRDKVIWDDATKTVTINTANKIVQFTAGSHYVKVNGAEVPIYSMDEVPKTVEAQIIDSRMYVPFRALGQAFGIPVSWIADSNTAVYNADAGNLK